MREKDGLWAVLCWLSILAVTGKSVEEVVRDHWRRFGRSYYQRHDYEGLDAAAAAEMMAELSGGLNSLAGTPLGGSRVERADEFGYTDPVDGSTTSRQGVRIFLEDGSRAVLRLSGTGTAGATLRIYIERYRDDARRERHRRGPRLAQARRPGVAPPARTLRHRRADGRHLEISRTASGSERVGVPIKARLSEHRPARYRSRFRSVNLLSQNFQAGRTRPLRAP